ncbi:PcfJ domain-containing protein [Shewanella sp. M16]|uniref:PcfJ domain-containing protein n=1 Tax=Shewanella sp. M16 TaxID=2830837 RepID=UPI001BAFE5A9|nr:PcfJ domain-containing protein [Shewanella sp. M16]MBS0044629.1 PcfJ domain-containing protein [Shewanella sp. M16]
MGNDAEGVCDNVQYSEVINNLFIVSECKTPIKLTLTGDAGSKIIKVGNWVAQDIFYNLNTPESNFHLKLVVLKANGIDLNPLLEVLNDTFTISENEDVRKQHWTDALMALHKAIAASLGSRFYAQLRAVSCQIWIDPVREKLNKYCLFWKNPKEPYFHKVMIRKLWNVHDLVETLEKDKLEHIITVCIFFESTPQELKKLLGKSIWKIICSNRKSFNESLVKCLLYYGAHELKDIAAIRCLMFFLLSVKKTLVKQCLFDKFNNYDYDDHYDVFSLNTMLDKDYQDRVLWCSRNGVVSKRNRNVFQLSELYLDTKQLCHTFGWVFKPWSIRSMIERLNRLNDLARDVRIKKELLLSNFYNANLNWLNQYDFAINKFRENNPEVHVELIKSYERLVTESEDMHHCFADYVFSIMRMQYVVISLICKESGYRSTVVFARNIAHKNKINQHYIKYNELNDLVENKKLSSCITGLEYGLNVFERHNAILHNPDDTVFKQNKLTVALSCDSCGLYSESRVKSTQLLGHNLIAWCVCTNCNSEAEVGLDEIVNNQIALMEPR